MTTSVNQELARIYQFPAGGRAALGGRRYLDDQPAIDATRVSSAACNGSWYHEAAIEESKPTWER